MADCKALSQYGDKGSPADGRPFTLDLYTVLYATARLRKRFTLRMHTH